MVGYLAVTARYGRFANFDEVWYKCAGLDWAKHGTFAAHELSGFGHFKPGFDKVFGVYPPLYPFAFGLYTRIVGFGWRQVCLFDAGIHVLLCVCVALLAPDTCRTDQKAFAVRIRSVPDPIPWPGMDTHVCRRPMQRMRLENFHMR